MPMMHTEFPTWFDHLPTEIVFMIFNYLSSNDIIDIFFFFNQRFNNLLLEYLNHIELPTLYSNRWEQILSILGSRIECLTIKTINLSFPLTYFPHLKSLILSSSCGFPNEELKLIVENKQFANLDSFKLKENKFYTNLIHDYHLANPYNILENVFMKKNSLKTFQYSLKLPPINNICKNVNLHSLTLVLYRFEDMFLLISYTPNLKYLNIRSPPSPFRFPSDKPMAKVNIKLKQLHLTINTSYDAWLDSNELVDAIQQFQSSLTCLSMNLVALHVEITNEFPFDNIKLEQFLESMIELKRFHLYTRISETSIKIDKENILSRFQNQFWFDHNWFFGMHGNYFYTLPFHFDYLYDFYQGFNNVKSSYPEILINNPRIWYNVKSIVLPTGSKYDFYFVKQLKIKMPQLNFIKFGSFYSNDITNTKYLHVNKDEQRTFNNVTTIESEKNLIENDKQWFSHALTKLTHLILHYGISTPIDDHIQRLDIVGYTALEQFTEINYVYLSNIQHIKYYMDNNPCPKDDWYKDKIMKLLGKFKNLKTFIYIDQQYRPYEEPSSTRLSKIIKYLNKEEIEKTYQVKYYLRYLLCLKHEYIND